MLDLRFFPELIKKFYKTKSLDFLVSKMKLPYFANQNINHLWSSAFHELQSIFDRQPAVIRDFQALC